MKKKYKAMQLNLFVNSQLQTGQVSLWSKANP